MIKATHAGDLRIGEHTVIPCAVLEDGIRVLTRTGVLRAIGRRGEAQGGRKYEGQYDEQLRIPVFLTAKNLIPFIDNDLLNNLTPIMFKPAGAGRGAIGYKAELLPQICNVFLEAEDAGVLLVQQRHIAQQCRTLIRGLAVVGITALVDEATGYQEQRDREELQKILAAYIAPELMPYTERFPEEFWQNMFRLRGWQYRRLSSGKGSPKGPRYAGKLTDELIYKKLPPGVREELRKKNPANEKSQRKHKLYRFLTEDVGDPHLTKQVAIVTTLMKVSSSWRTFKGLFERAFADPNAHAQGNLFPDLEEEDEE